MNCFRKSTQPAKVQAPSKMTILEQALKKSILLSSTESLNCLDVDEDPPVMISPITTPTKPEKKTSLPAQKKTSSPSTSSVSSVASDLLKKFQALRKTCHASRTPCKYIFRKGPKKGEECGVSSAICEVFCSKHLAKKPSCSTSDSTSTPETFKKLRINRLKRGKRYFFVRVVAFPKIVVVCDGKHYILLLSHGLDKPECLSKRHYLIRNFEGHAEWKQAPKSSTC